MTNKSTVSLQSLCHAIQTMGEKLTHLYLAHNKLAGVPQIVTALSVTEKIALLCFDFSLSRSFHFARLDILSEFNVAGLIQRKYNSRVSWISAHRKASARLPEA